MVPASEIQAHRADVAALALLASDDIRVLIGQVSTVEQAREALNDVLPALIRTYGEAAATLGADWYDDMRDLLDIPGAFRAIPAQLPDVGRAYALSGWATTPAQGVDVFLPDIVTEKVSGGLQRAIADTDRFSLVDSAVADPLADGWQRVGSGECGFCSMLIARGAVYTERTATFGSHDHCRCAAVPAFGGQPVTVKPYEPTSRNITDADRARVRDFIRDNGL